MAKRTSSKGHAAPQGKMTETQVAATLLAGAKAMNIAEESHKAGMVQIMQGLLPALFILLAKWATDINQQMIWWQSESNGGLPKSHEVVRYFHRLGTDAWWDLHGEGKWKSGNYVVTRSDFDSALRGDDTFRQLKQLAETVDSAKSRLAVIVDCKKAFDKASAKYNTLTLFRRYFKQTPEYAAWLEKQPKPEPEPVQPVAVADAVSGALIASGVGRGIGKLFAMVPDMPLSKDTSTAVLAGIIDAEVRLFIECAVAYGPIQAGTMPAFTDARRVRVINAIASHLNKKK